LSRLGKNSAVAGHSLPLTHKLLLEAKQSAAAEVTNYKPILFIFSFLWFFLFLLLFFRL
jgi:hypothetical protein